MKLFEIIGHYNLTDNQKKVLVACAVSGTPQQAYEFTIGNSGLVSARNTLVNIGMIAVQGNRMGLTNDGQQALREYNLTDQNGQLTQDAMDLLQNNGDEQAASMDQASQGADASQ